METGFEVAAGQPFKLLAALDQQMLIRDVDIDFLAGEEPGHQTGESGLGLSSNQSKISMETSDDRPSFALAEIDCRW